MKITHKFLLAVLIALTAAACQKEEPPTDEGTFVKSKFTNKDWYNRDSSRHYNFDKSGAMNSRVGTWYWKGTSDSVLIDLPEPFLDEQIIVNYITDTEMRCRYSFNTAKFETFKCIPW